MRPRIFIAFCCLLLLLFAAGTISFFSFTAEDAWITYRYAENFSRHGALVFNMGEAVCAFTSPLHVLISAALSTATGATLLANKILGLSLLIASLLLVVRRLAGNRLLQATALALLAPSPCIILWSFGGLETPLLLFLGTIAALTMGGRTESDSGAERLRALTLMAGIGFLLRYDSILFFLPALVHGAVGLRKPGKILAAALPGMLAPAAWLSFSLLYYGNILPTSFYVKAPVTNVLILLKNGAYIAIYLVTTGLLPAALLPLIFSRGKISGMRALHFLREEWPLSGGIALLLLYGLTVATTHMMFSFRFFVPFLPAAVLLTVKWLGRTMDAEAAASGTRIPRAAGWYILCLLLIQGFLLYHTHFSSLNGLTFIGEYRKVGVTEYGRFIDLLRREAEDIRKHWSATEEGKRRPPRVHTFAAGMLPYTLREAIIYEKLVSYRPGAPAGYDSLNKYAADYIHILVPRHGPLREQLPKPAGEYRLVSKYEMVFDGTRQEFLVYYTHRFGVAGKVIR